MNAGTEIRSAPRLKLYSTARCPLCAKTKQLLAKWSIPYTELRIDEGTTALREFVAITNGARAVPQIAIDGKWIGGFSELTELHMDGKLEELVAVKQ